MPSTTTRARPREGKQLRVFVPSWPTPATPRRSGPYRYCSQECVEADADHQANQI